MGRTVQQVEFRLLGPLEVLVDGRRVPLGGSRQDKLLAVLLLDQDRVVTPARLIDALWDEDPPETARKQVHNAIAAVRGRLGPARDLLVTEGGGYRVDVAPDAVDVHRFRRAVETADGRIQGGDPASAATALADALLLWRGPALAGLTGRVLEAAAAKLDEQRVAATETLFGVRLDLGEAADLVPELVRLVAEHPLRERLAFLLMLALHRGGRGGEALRVFERTRVLLAEELGVDPGPELRDLHQRLLRDDPAPAPARSAPSQLPRDIADFTGRRPEVDRLLGLLSASGGTAVVITALDGMAGVGKTTLAVRIGHLLASSFPDGQVFLDLHGFTPGQEPVSAAAALDFLLRGMGVPPEQVPDDLDARAGRWRSVLAGKRVLVLLDNALDSAQLRPLLPGAPGACVLATSRRRLADLEGASSISLDVMPADDAIALFHAVLGTPVDRDRAAEVVALCGFLPLAIRIAASRLRSRPHWTIADLARRLRDERRGLSELSSGDRSVSAAFAVSYQHLDVRQRRAFRLLGLHPGPLFDAHSAAALLDVTADEAERLLEDLLDVHLLLGHVDGRYRFHDLLRRHARALAEQREAPRDVVSALRRLAEHHVELGLAVERVIDPGRDLGLPAPHRRSALPHVETPADARAALAAAQPNVLPLVRAALDRGLLDVAWQVPVALGPGLLRHGHVEQALAGYEHGLEAARAQDAAAAATVHRNLGVALLGIGRFAEATRTLRHGLDIERERGDERGVGRMLANLGIAHIRLGRHDEAVVALNRAVEALERHGNPRDLAAALANLGVVRTRLGHHEAAVEHHLRALAINTDLGNEYMVASSHLNLGWLHIRSGRLTPAREHLDEALAHSRRIGDREIEARALHHLADCARRQGLLAEALDTGRAALVLGREIGNRDVEVFALDVLGEVHRDLGDAEAARDCFSGALRLTDGAPTIRDVLAHDGLARLAADRGDTTAAASHWSAAAEIAAAARLPEAADFRRRLDEVART
ncbi:MAG: tetratricopeptide repeat protein [Saccharothrix sp.]|nr:tetratricopeptide repeat protein [Saccharothrix sp.]